MASANGPFLYSQTVHSDLSGSVWDATTAEGSQTFNHGETEEFPFSFGHITPRGHGQDHIEVVDDMSSKWMATEDAAPAVVSEPMRRISSRGSSSSHKHRALKASSQQKNRPRILSSVSQGSHMSNYDMSGNAHMDAYLLDSDAHSVSSQMFYPTLPMGMGLGSDGLPYTPDVLPASMGPSHMDPVHMQLDFGHSPSASWASSLSPIESRISSPGIPEESWTSAPLEASPQVVSASPVMDGQSPRYVWSAPAEEGCQNLTAANSCSLQRGLMSDDVYGNDQMENSFLPPAFSRRSTGDGESTARDHPLYKSAQPSADGLFHCPWEGSASCNHKPEKLKCNYE